MEAQRQEVKGRGIIGIDAGGTYTDLVFLDGKEKTVRLAVKTPTLHNDLVQTVENGLRELLKEVEPSQVGSFNIATTLATNAIVEDKLRPAALILIGYGKKLAEEAARQGGFGAEQLYMVKGGHDAAGNEREPLDEEALRRCISELPASIKSVGVSGYFSVRNASHENRAAELIQSERPDLYISCGHDLSTDLDAVRRATTTAVNAGLIPIVMELLSSVETVCRNLGLETPVTVVRGDGSIVGADWAKGHPVEMILSGPAASACGARFLAGEKAAGRETWIADIGGTTTDLIRLDKKGKPALSEAGAEVAGRRTLVKAIDIHTFALGGDTQVRCSESEGVFLGKRRVLPLCRLAGQFPQALAELKKLSAAGWEEPLLITAGDVKGEDDYEKFVQKKLAEGPLSRASLLEGEPLPRMKYDKLNRMEEEGKICYAAFTPTDALHVLGEVSLWDAEASVLGARLLGRFQGKSPEETAAMVKDMTVRAIARGLIQKGLSDRGIGVKRDGQVMKLIEEALTAGSPVSAMVRFSLDAMLIGAGAPAGAFMPPAGKLAGEHTLLPENAQVAGAAGAAAGAFSLVYTVRVSPLSEGGFRVHLPEDVRDFEELEDAVCCGEEFMKPWLSDRAKRAGAAAPAVTVRRHDEIAAVNRTGMKIYLYTQLHFEVTDEA